MPRGFSRGGRSGGSGGGGFSFGGGGGGFRVGFGSSGSSYNRGGSDYNRSHSRPRGPRRPWRMHFFGRTVILAGPAQTLLSLLLGAFIFAIVFLVGIFGNLGTTKEYMAESEEMIAKYEESDPVFANIIQKAKLNEDDDYFLTVGEFKDKKYTSYEDNPKDPGYYETDYYEKGQNYFFIVCEFEYAPEDEIGQQKTEPGKLSTFIEFTFEGTFADQGISDMIDGVGSDRKGEIEIAYTYINGNVVAINTSYTLERNKDYQVEKDYLEDLKESKKSYTKMIVIAFAVIGVVVLIAVLFFVKKYKQAKKNQEVQDAKNEAEIAEARANAELAEAKASQVGRKCKYCGADVPDGDDVCPACGSRQFEKD